MSLPVDRRDFLKSTLGAGVGAAALASSQPVSAQRQASASATLFAAPALPRVCVGVIGLGNQGPSHVENFTKIEGVDIVALCDLVPAKVEKVQAMVEKAGAPRPAGYSGNPDAWRRLCDSDLDLVFIATPWDMHAPMAIEAMKKGKHAAVEVPMAVTLDECWQMVETAEQTKRHCVMMENCCYDYDELLILNMVRAGVFGELVHGEAAYNHDLRAILFETKDEGLWRRAHHMLRDSNLYPTHGLGPVANYMNINRGDKFDYMVAMSSGSLGLQDYRKEKLDANDPRQKEVYKAGDYNTNLIKTAKGRSIMVQHNVTTPRPYDRINLIQGTKGIFRDYPSRVYVEKDKANHQWQPVDAYKEKYEHDLWRVVGEQARKLGGHGGMDYLMCWRLVQCFREGLVPDMDVYDAAAWSSPGPLSEISVQKGSMPIKFPDFTRGKWTGARTSIP